MPLWKNANLISKNTLSFLKNKKVQQAGDGVIKENAHFYEIFFKKNDKF
jgi:hypothetical protein